jgi:lipid-binding SYLF domain-containing protein
MKRTALVLIGALLLASLPAFAAWEANVDDKVQVKAAAAIDRLRERVPRTQAYFEQAYAFAIFPSVTRIGLGFGGAYGKGIVIEGDSLVGRSKYKQFTSGIQAGARNFSMIVFFKDREALEYYQTGKTQFMGQAGIALGSFGAAGTPAYNEGVAVVTVTRLGLMGEFTISGAKFTYEPVATK